MSVGEKAIDAQHQKLLTQVNALIEAMVFGPTSKEVNEALKFFDEYINEHFSYEENYMQRRGFLNIEQHKIRHQDFRNKYSEFLEKLKNSTTSREVLIEMEEFLGRWWLEHIGHEDREYYIAFGGEN